MTTQTPRRRVLWLLITLVAVLLVGVGVAVGLLLQRPASVTLPDGSKLQDVAASVAALPPCGELFMPGKQIDDAKARAGCRDMSGQIVVLGSHQCKDGRELYTVDAPRGWGFGGDAFRATAGEVAADPAYAEAYQACLS